MGNITKRIIAKEVLIFFGGCIATILIWCILLGHSMYIVHQIEQQHSEFLANVKSGDRVPDWDLPENLHPLIKSEQSYVDIKDITSNTLSATFLLMLILYPGRLLFCLLRWSINTLKNSSLNPNKQP